MASFYAELHLEGVAIPMLQCSYSFQQTTDARGRVAARVRQGPLQLLLDVPDDGAELLLSWAATPFKPLAGQVIFYDDSQARLPRETISFAAGQCVHYEEAFRASDAENGAYTCQLTITAPEFELLAGGPAAPALAAIGGAKLPSLAAVPSLALAAAAAVASPAAAAKAFVAEYTLTEFAKTIKGAKHMQPPEVIEQIYGLFNAASAASAPGKPSVPHWKAVEDLVRSSYYVDPDDGKTKPLNDHWPPANGGYQRQNVQLKKGDVFDRYQGDVFDKKVDPVKGRVDLEPGDEFDVTFAGTFLSPIGQEGTPKVVQSFESRALDRAEDKYAFGYTVEILQDVPLDLVQGELAEVIPWYGQPGGGTQMRLTFPTTDPAGNNWKYEEWRQMQANNFAKITLNSSPSGDYKVLPNNRAKKLT
ncbi:type VI secretion system tube protein TssD [Hymenobacter chitinivorans]|uniref:Uncharacterized protein DUF4237 n=1 Tax=Hymenobacter chitinivorans DSM 11115 TaxID=1121954 RepID=A0A2M9BTJ9_9BACT|nr:type VI secretion system tube protein TssD [Hymenobacter chitinivorans]PJJ61274.1 uncharacterized protein DUF4237 [Hymenobacter chitinivorans DSM 11115]